MTPGSCRRGLVVHSRVPVGRHGAELHRPVGRCFAVARNRELYRLVNDKIAEVASEFWVVADTQGFNCECSRDGCSELVEIPLEMYDRVRAIPGAFLVVPGHEDPAREQTILVEDDFVVVVSMGGA